jgi:hypothetical protein
MVQKIAFLFLLYDGLSHPTIWRDYFKRAGSGEYSVHIHTKAQKSTPPAPWTSNDKHVHLVRTVPTTWGGIGLVHATLQLLSGALQDPDNTMFFLVSGSCLPVKHFPYLYNKIIKEDTRSRFSVNLNDPDVYPRYNILKRIVPPAHITKSHQWFIANRSDAQVLVKDQHTYLPWMRNVFIPDEVVFLTYLKTIGRESKILIATDRAEHSTWTSCKDGKPINYAIIPDELWVQIQKRPNTFFARKFQVGAKIKELLS